MRTILWVIGWMNFWAQTHTSLLMDPNPFFIIGFVLCAIFDIIHFVKDIG